MKKILIIICLLSIVLLMLSCAKEADTLPRLDIVQTYSITGNPQDFDIYGNTLFVAEGITGFSLHNLSTAERLYFVQQTEDWTFGDTRWLRYIPSLEALLVYDRGNGNALYTFSYTEQDSLKANPIRIIGNTSNIRDIIYETVSDDPLQVRTFYGYFEGPNNAVQTGFYRVSPNPAHYSAVEVDMPNAIYALSFHRDHTILGAMGERGLVIFNDKSNLADYSFFNTPGSARDVTSKGTIAYIADHSAGLQIVDIADTKNPILLGNGFATQSNAISLDILGNYLAVGTTNGGLYLFDISDLVNPKPIDRLSANTIGEINKVKWHNGDIYVASRHHGIVKIKVRR